MSALARLDESPKDYFPEFKLHLCPQKTKVKRSMNLVSLFQTDVVVGRTIYTALIVFFSFLHHFFPCLLHKHGCLLHSSHVPSFCSTAFLLKTLLFDRRTSCDRFPMLISELRLLSSAQGLDLLLCSINKAMNSVGGAWQLFQVPEFPSILDTIFASRIWVYCFNEDKASMVWHTRFDASEKWQTQGRRQKGTTTRKQLTCSIQEHLCNWIPTFCPLLLAGY